MMITMHPGEYLCATYMKPNKVSQQVMAHFLQVDKSTVSRLLNGKIELTANMACRLSKVLDLSAKAWMEMQVNHSLQQAEKELADVKFTRLK